MFAQLPPKCGMDAAQHRAAGGIGYGKKTIISDYGECEIAVPRDRNGDFEPKVIEKRQTRTNGSNRKSCRYVRQLNKVQLGMSQCDIENALKQIYGIEISQGLVSRITDKILPEANEWQTVLWGEFIRSFSSMGSYSIRARITKLSRNACTLCWV